MFGEKTKCFNLVLFSNPRDKGLILVEVYKSQEPQSETYGQVLGVDRSLGKIDIGTGPGEEVGHE